MAVFIAKEGDDRLPPLPLNDTTSVQPQAHRELNALRASIESTIEQHMQERTVAFLLSNARTIVHQQASAPFYAVNGAQYRTVHEFALGAQRLASHEFNHHVNAQRNDFANWLADCFAEPAKKLGAAIQGKDREEILELLQHLEDYSKIPVQPLKLPPQEPASIVPAAKEPAYTQHIPFEPLPPPPIALPNNIEHVHSELLQIQQLMKTDLPAAREHFIELRTYVWQLSEHERKEVMPLLRETYHVLVAAGK